MEELLHRIDEACAQYCSEELADAGFQRVIDEIPTEARQEKDSALKIVKALVDNEDLYEVSLVFRKKKCPNGSRIGLSDIYGTSSLVQ